MKYSVFCKFRHDLANASTLKELESICVQFVEFLGLDFYLFGIFESISHAPPKVITFSNYPRAWASRYFDRKCFELDPIFKYCLINSSPAVWSDLMTHKENQSAEAIALMEEAKKEGLSEGVVFPMKSESGQVALLNLASKHEPLTDNQLGDILPAGHIFAKYLLDAYSRIDQVNNPKVAQLTPRELECVFWACEGKTAWEMSQIVGVTERTVNFHLTSVIKKLGASNRQHAVAKAVMFGLVRPTP